MEAPCHTIDEIDSVTIDLDMKGSSAREWLAHLAGGRLGRLSELRSGT